MKCVKSNFLLLDHIFLALTYTVASKDFRFKLVYYVSKSPSFTRSFSSILKAALTKTIEPVAFGMEFAGRRVAQLQRLLGQHTCWQSDIGFGFSVFERWRKRAFWSQPVLMLLKRKPLDLSRANFLLDLSLAIPLRINSSQLCKRFESFPTNLVL